MKFYFYHQLTILTRLPIAFAGKLRWNLARTPPLLPCGRVIFPQITLICDGLLSLRPPTAVLLFIRKKYSIKFNVLKGDN